MRHPTQATLMPPAQAEALYDIALERESNQHDPDVSSTPADGNDSMSSTAIRDQIRTDLQKSGAARIGQALQTVLSENLALPPNVPQTNY